MSNYPAIIVSGLPRTGTTLTMRMLHAGGVPIRDGTHLASMEHPNSADADVVKYLPYPGQAVKILEMMLRYIPTRPRPGVVPIVLWCHRDPIEQARSARKLLALADMDGGIDGYDSDDLVPFTTDEIGRVAMFLQNRARQTLRTVQEKRQWATAGMAFEATLQNPEVQAARLREMLKDWWPRFDAGAARDVVRGRNPDARPDLEQEASDLKRYQKEGLWIPGM